MKTWLALALGALAGCGDPEDDRPPGALEIGVRGAEGAFTQLVDGDTMIVSLGPNGLNMVVPCLRSSEIDPQAPDPTVSVQVADQVMAADIEGARVDMVFDGTGNVLWDLRVPFQTELCCFVCREGLVEARIKDASGRRFVGSVTVRLERGGCPDEAACCESADMCPDPSLTQTCE
jgi:hypothetical protein